MNRAERRRTGDRTPVLIAGDGIVAAELPGHRFEARPAASLRPKRPGTHRWIASVAYVLSDTMASEAFAPDRMKFLDQENLMYIAIGCWDCEQVLGAEGVAHDSVCSAPADDGAEG